MASDLSTNLVEIAAEQLDPAGWATIQLLKGTRPDMTGAEAEELIRKVFRQALAMASAELLDACQYVLRFLDEYDADRDWHPSLRTRLTLAIAKASGEKP